MEFLVIYLIGSIAAFGLGWYFWLKEFGEIDLGCLLVLLFIFFGSWVGFLAILFAEIIVRGSKITIYKKKS